MISSKTALTFTEAIDNIKNQLYVVYIDDLIISNQTLLDSFVLDVKLLKLLGMKFIIIHGGDTLIEETYEELLINQTISSSHRIPNKNSILFTEMILSGLINKKIVNQFEI